MEITHEPVLLKEVLESLHINNQVRIIDATLGAGGYSLEILKRGGSVLGIDFDPKMLARARERLEIACPGSFFKAVNANFIEIDRVAKANGFTEVDGIVFDLGVSNIHFLGDDRGFSFQDKSAPLDMRLNQGVQGVTAADLLNNLREDQLSGLLGWGLAKKVIEARKLKPFRVVGDLTDLIGEKRLGKIHPATKAFLALRMAVGSELENLEEALPKAYGLLKPGGRLVVVTFNSLEQKTVRSFGRGKLLTGKGIAPNDEEIAANPKSRSALLNVIEKND